VNSACATFTRIAAAGNDFHGGFYASDHEDIPSGLPEDSRVFGVWRLGLYGRAFLFELGSRVVYQGNTSG